MRTKLKLSLHIGINYPGTDAQLSGCVNDAKDWAAAYAARGFSTALLLDGAATRDRMLAELRALTLRLHRGDVGVITYSGHGTWVPDNDGDESDGRDEAICPVDLWDAGVITDDVLYEIFSARLAGAKLIFISDSCHSGTVDRFVSAAKHGDRPRSRARFLPPAQFLVERSLARAQRIAASKDNKPRTSALLLAGCRDDQVSYDAWFRENGQWRARGAFSQAALAALDTVEALSVTPTYRRWYRAITPNLLPNDEHDQQPQLQGSLTQKTWKLH